MKHTFQCDKTTVLVDTARGRMQEALAENMQH